MDTRGEASGIVHKEHYLSIEHVLGSKSKDHGEYSQKLKSVDVLTPFLVGDFVGVDGPGNTRDVVPCLDKPSLTETARDPPMTKLVVNEQNLIHSTKHSDKHRSI